MWMRATNTSDVPGISGDFFVTNIPGMRENVKIPLVPSMGMTQALKNLQGEDDEMGALDAATAFIETQLPEKALKYALRASVQDIAKVFAEWLDAVNQASGVSAGESDSSESFSATTQEP